MQKKHNSNVLAMVLSLFCINYQLMPNTIWYINKIIHIFGTDAEWCIYESLN